MLDVINAFSEKDTRDELGFGSVRDAFADTLFPGTSTIQTRARYFLFVPWIYEGQGTTWVYPNGYHPILGVSWQCFYRAACSLFTTESRSRTSWCATPITDFVPYGVRPESPGGSVGIFVGPFH